MAQNCLDRPGFRITDGSQYYRRTTVLAYPAGHETSPCCGSRMFFRTDHICKSTPLEPAASSLPLHSPFFKIPDLVSSFHQLSGFQNRLFSRSLRRKVTSFSFFPVNNMSNRSLLSALTLTK